MKFIRIVVEAAKTYYDEAFNLMIMGSVTTLSCILIIPGPFAFGGLWAAAQRAVRKYGFKWHNYWKGVKEYGLRNFGLTLILALGYIIFLTNLWFYNTPEISPFPEKVAVWLTPLWLVLILLWTGVAFYANAFLVELKEPKLLSILRSSLFLSLLHPLTTLFLLVLSAVLLALSIVVPVLMLITPGMILILRLTAVRSLIQVTTDKYQTTQEIETDEENNE